MDHGRQYDRRWPGEPKGCAGLAVVAWQEADRALRAARQLAVGASSTPLHAHAFRLRGSGIAVVRFQSGDQRPKEVINKLGVKARYQLMQPGEYIWSTCSRSRCRRRS